LLESAHLFLIDAVGPARWRIVNPDETVFGAPNCARRIIVELASSRNFCVARTLRAKTWRKMLKNA
jgi:hypothetical protein